MDKEYYYSIVLVMTFILPTGIFPFDSTRPGVLLLRPIATVGKNQISILRQETSRETNYFSSTVLYDIFPTVSRQLPQV
ncbi:hypothetical protein DERF_000928 [Dermatophagoides farinae]|uniref:Uncharacterized protein n=1 Tax=Dermatophagoides farinae TaxID=6954 RepID=A0A922LCQ3_DERFA|nr:hypothetical protein DERF_000928 [Dermatophagoides farinae]